MRPVLAIAAGRSLVAVLLAGGLLVGCSGEEGGTDAVSPPVGVAVPTWTGGPIPQSSPAQAEWAAPLSRAVPARVRIPRIGVSAPVDQLGLRSNGRIQEPPLSRPNLTGWYKEGPSPGEAGPAVLLGHVDANGRRAVFYRLSELRTSDRIELTRRDGKVAVFAVQQVVRVAKRQFPGQQIYAEDIDYPSLRLVTCGGRFNSRTGHYEDNIIVFARLVTR